MDADRVWSVLKWVLAALAAGFIGQFGRSLALHLIERRRRRRGLPDARTDPPPPRRVEAENAEADRSAKIEKKRAKAEVKRAKKALTEKEKGADDSD
jgi:hypothetical protein